MSTVIYDTPVLAEKYDAVSNSQFEHGMSLVKELNINIDDRVLDIGCGTGRLAEYVAKKLEIKGMFTVLTQQSIELRSHNKKSEIKILPTYPLRLEKVKT